MCRIEKQNWSALPQIGPLITYVNHTGTLEAPLVFTQMMPRKATGLAKIETWDNWFLGWVFNLWEIIPIHRGEADMEAMRRCLEMLDKGYFLGMSPEGTRSKSGALLRAHGGMALLALKSGAALVPIGQTGCQDFGSNIKKLKTHPRPTQCRAALLPGCPRRKNHPRNPPADGRRDDVPTVKAAAGRPARRIC